MSSVAHPFTPKQPLPKTLSEEEFRKLSLDHALKSDSHLYDWLKTPQVSDMNLDNFGEIEFKRVKEYTDLYDCERNLEANSTSLDIIVRNKAKHPEYHLKRIMFSSPNDEYQSFFHVTPANSYMFGLGWHNERIEVVAEVVSKKPELLDLELSKTYVLS